MNKITCIKSLRVLTYANQWLVVETKGVMYSNENRIRDRYVSLSHFIMLMNVHAVLYPMHCGCCVQAVKYTNPCLWSMRRKICSFFFKQTFQTYCLRLCMPHCSPCPFTIGVCSTTACAHLATYYFRSASFWNFMQRGMVVCHRCFATNYRPLLRGPRSFHGLLDPWRW
jgi:hypothetical protein